MKKASEEGRQVSLKDGVLYIDDNNVFFRWIMVLIDRLMATMLHNNLKRFMFFNSRGFNESKQCYIRRILSDCDLLFCRNID